MDLAVNTKTVLGLAPADYSPNIVEGPEFNGGTAEEATIVLTTGPIPAQTSIQVQMQYKDGAGNWTGLPSAEFVPIADETTDPRVVKGQVDLRKAESGVYRLLMTVETSLLIPIPVGVAAAVILSGFRALPIADQPPEFKA